MSNFNLPATFTYLMTTLVECYVCWRNLASFPNPRAFNVLLDTMNENTFL